MTSLLVKLLLFIAPGLGNPLATAIIGAAVAVGDEEVKIMLPIVRNLIAQANANPQFTSGPQKFVWVFEQSAAAFPGANREALGTMINIAVQEATAIAKAL